GDLRPAPAVDDLRVEHVSRPPFLPGKSPRLVYSTLGPSPGNTRRRGAPARSGQYGNEELATRDRPIPGPTPSGPTATPIGRPRSPGPWTVGSSDHLACSRVHLI